MMQTWRETPVPWILSMFDPLLNSDQKRYRLQRLTIDIFLHHAETQWDEWAAFDALFQKQEFDSLQMVTISMSRVLYITDGQAVVEKLSGQLHLLKRSGKLKLSMFPE